MAQYIVSANDSEKLDVELFFPGDRYPVTVGPGLVASRWRGGIWVQYVTGAYEWTVEVSDGNEVAGFLPFQSENYDLSPPYGLGPGSNANFISYQPATGVGGQNVVNMVVGSTRAMFKVYETVALAGGARVGGPIVYALHDVLKVSENGLLCNDSDAQLALAGVVTPHEVGIVSAVPSAQNGWRLGADI